MKKSSILVVAVIAASFASCTAQAPKATLKTDVDSLSYALGVAQTQGLSQYLTGRLGLEPSQINDFVKGFAEGAKKTSKKDIAYSEGFRIGQQMGSKESLDGLNKEVFAGDSTQTVNLNNIIAGFIAGAKNDTTFMKAEEASAYFQAKMEEIKAANMEKKYGDNKGNGEKFLAENKDKEGVVTTESGLQYKIITAGKGAIPTDKDRVKVNYKGTLIDGTEFDSSYKRNEPATFGTTQVIKGWTEALLMMPVGSKWELYIPEDLAYGARETGNIPPYSTLIFEVELVEIVK